MKHIFFLASVLIWMCSCSGDPAESPNDSAAIDSGVDTSIRIDSPTNISRVDSPVADTVAAEPKVRGSFRVLYTSNSCGGARPVQGIVEQYGTPTPLTTSTLKFRNHYSGKEYFLKTDAKGEISADLEEGKYDVFFTKDINPNLPHTGFDPKCSLWINQLLLTVKVTASARLNGEVGQGKMQDVNVHFICNPCDENSKMRQ